MGEKKETKKGNRMIGIMVCVIVLLFLAAGIVFGLTEGGFLGKNKFVIGRDIKEDQFLEFYYTESSTAYPPTFQRYRFYTDFGKHMFYHEKREGDKVFLEEEDITVSGTMELSEEEWNTFWNFMNGATVQKRTENTNSGGSGPWLYFYWEKDPGDCQEFHFPQKETESEFEEFCIRLKEKEQVK